MAVRRRHRPTAAGEASPLIGTAADVRGYIVRRFTVGVAGDVELIVVMRFQQRQQKVRDGMLPQVRGNIADLQTPIRRAIVGVIGNSACAGGAA